MYTRNHVNAPPPPHSQVILELGANEGTDVLRVVLDRQLRVVFEILPSCTCDRCKVAWSRYICKKWKLSLFCFCAPASSPTIASLSLAPLILLPLQLLRLWFFSCCAETLYVRAGVRVRVYVCTAHGSNGSLPLFAWSHVAVVHDVDGKVHIYLNGTKEPAVMQAHICTQPCAHTRPCTVIHFWHFSNACLHICRSLQ
jgi:hypothetical protein